MIKVAIAGAAGNMGRETVKAVSAQQDMTLVAAIDTHAEGSSVSDGRDGQIACRGDLTTALQDTRPDVFVDFTHPDSVAGNVAEALSQGIDCVVGTTGLSHERLTELAANAPKGTCLFVAPNFAIGAILMMRFAQAAARFMPHVEVIELHHDRKADSPSGTALRTARLIAESRGSAPEIPGTETELPGFSGARGSDVDGIRVHSVRLPGLVACQEVIFGGQGQTLSIRHDTIDRTSFMPGVLLAIREVGSRSGLVVGLEHFMGE